MKSFFWDSNLFIYLIEQHPIYCSQVTQLRQYNKVHGDSLSTSVLTYGEVLVYPLKTQNQPLIQAYQQIFLHSDLHLIPFTPTVAEHFAGIRARSHLKPPDAFQLACAATQGVDYFVTNDQALTHQFISGIGCIISLSDLLRELDIEITD